MTCEENKDNGNVVTVTKKVETRKSKQMVFHNPPNLGNQKKIWNSYAVDEG